MASWPKGKPILAGGKAKPSASMQASAPKAPPTQKAWQEEALEEAFRAAEVGLADESSTAEPQREEFVAPQPKRAPGPSAAVGISKGPGTPQKPVAKASLGLTARPSTTAKQAMPSSPSGPPSFMGAAVRKRQLELSQGAAPRESKGSSGQSPRPGGKGSEMGHFGHEAPSYGMPPRPPAPPGYGPMHGPLSHAPPQHYPGYGYAPHPQAWGPPNHGYGAQVFGGHYPAAPHHPPSPARPSYNEPAKGQGKGPPPPPAPCPEARQLNFDDSSVRWIEVGDDAPIVQQGYHKLAPCFVHSPAAAEILSSVHYILHELLGDDASSEVILNHDADWSLFPEVGEAIKAAGLEETSYCLAICASQGKWAVGMAGKWKQREQATRLALCIALAANAESLRPIITKHPEFGQLCQSAGIAIEDEDGEIPIPMSAAPAVEGWTPSKKRRKAARQNDEAGEVQESRVEVSNGDSLPRDVPFWVKLPADEPVPDQLEAMPTEALAVSTEGARKGLYGHVEQYLAVVIADSGDEVEYIDDANWENLPVVGAALKQVCPKEECMTVAVCAARGIWAVGVGMKGKNRYAAAKLAIATSLAIQLNEADQELDLSEHPAFADFIAETKESKSQL